MHELSSPTSSSQSRALRLGGSHGYRIEGDLAALNAELSLGRDRSALRAQHWALQLWACDEPYGGGALSGFKVAEAPIALPAGEAEAPLLDTVAFARPPAASRDGGRDYSMVLVLAAGQPGAFDQVHDFANYPARERFVGPHFEGSVGYRVLPEGGVALRAERVLNPRAATNLSGSLALQLWALAEPYRGGSFAGALLASAAIGRVHGQSEIEPGEQQSALAAPSPEGAQLVLMLCEWTAEGYQTRDYCNFGDPASARTPAAPANEPAAPAQELAAPAHELAAPAHEPAAPAHEPAAPAHEPAALAYEPAAPTPGAAREPAPAAEDRRPSLRTASADELVLATGISKKLAADIVRARPFKSFDELGKLRGIGEKTIRKFRSALKF